MQPQATSVRAAGRAEFVDALRGFALFGVFGANLLSFSGYAYMSDAQRAALPTAGADGAINLLELVLVENKFMGLFSFLFGISFWLFLRRADARGDDGARLFYRRLAWLFAIGAAHGWLFWLWDILRFYALWGLLLPLFARLPNRRLMGAAFFFAVLAPALVSGFRMTVFGPAVPDSGFEGAALQTFSSGPYADVLRLNWSYDWHVTLSVGQVAYQVSVLGRLLLGLCAARALQLADLRSHARLFRALLVGGAAVGVAGNALALGHYLDSAAGGFLLPFCRRLVAEVGNLGLTLAYASGLALLFEVPRWRRLLLLLAPAGRMALTCFLSQTLFGLWLFYGFMPGPGLMGKVGPLWLVMVWLGGYAVQVWLASLWLRRFRFGPAEWLWRSLTYWEIQPLRLAARPTV